MNKYTFDQIRESVLQWSQSDIPNRIASSEYFEITKNVVSNFVLTIYQIG